MEHHKLELRPYVNYSLILYIFLEKMVICII